MLMYKENGGFCNFPEGTAPTGWVPGQPIWDALMAAKLKDAAKSDTVTLPPIANPVETVTITPQPEVKRSPGRPRNVVPSVLNDGEI